jgi:beta-xylosidase/regulation of enolase protein 1 (concanavalin A-like superfamily)
VREIKKLNMKNFTLLTLIFLLVINLTNAQKLLHNSPGTGNPFIPGYFADPTVKKFGDTWYIYSTTDGNNDGRGPATVWTSKDFVNWTMHEMNWPITQGGFYWAPDVTIGPDGKYRLFYNIPCETYEGIGESPLGPWKNILGEDKTLIPNYLVPDIITLDAQTFKDDDGKIYILFGTWGIYPRSGCGIGLLNPDMKSFAKLDKIPNTQAIDFFEAPFIIKKDGIYYFTYSSGSCHDSTYRVQYAISRTSPFGPYEYGKNNPILETSKDGSVHGPGHHCIIQEGSEYYIIYHRHDNPHSARGMHRQLCIDKLKFGPKGTIEKVIPTHEGVGFLAKNTNPAKNLAFGKLVKASSFYNQNFKPEFAADDNNGTHWKAAKNNESAWLMVDLEKTETVKRTHAEFLYPTTYYQYLIEYSTDGQNWKTFADRRNNRLPGCPMVDTANVSARYLRITITNIEKPGMFAGLWNFKVFSETDKNPVKPQIYSVNKEAAAPRSQGLLVDLDVSKFRMGENVQNWPNKGVLGGMFKSDAATAIDLIDGYKAMVFSGNEMFTSPFKAPLSLSGNSSFTVAYWAHNPEIGDEENIVSFAHRGGPDASAANFGYGSNKAWGAAAHWGWADLPYKNGAPKAGKWHHIAVTFDGYKEKIYVDGKLTAEHQRMLYMHAGDPIFIGAAAEKFAPFSGALASVKIYDISLTEPEIKMLADENLKSDINIYLNPCKLNYGELKSWKNDGSFGNAFEAGSTQVQVDDVAGKIAAIFNGTGSLQFEAPKLSTSDFCIEGAVLNSDLQARACFLNLTDEQNQLVCFQLGKDKKAGAISSSFGEKCGFREVPAINQWHHFAVKANGQNISFFVDGKLIGSVSNKLKAGYLKINLGNTGFKGALSFVKMSQNAISDQEISALFANWSQNNQALAGIEPEFDLKPAAITTSLVYMKAKPISAVQYNFVETTGNSVIKNSGWQNAQDWLHCGLVAEKNYTYLLKIKDIHGNIKVIKLPVSVSTQASQLSIISDDFSAKKDFLSQGFAGTIWDGFTGKGKRETVDTLLSENGQLLIKSGNSKWDGSQPTGPFLFKNISGDFVAELEIPEVAGQKERKAQGPNDCGLMVRVADLSQAGNGEDLLQISLFPGWNVGNMFTNFDGEMRTQDQNNAGWQFDHFVQIQRMGNTFFIRTSADGKIWKDFRNTPVVRPDLNGLPLQIGVYQCSYREQSAWGRFANFKIYQKK